MIIQQIRNATLKKVYGSITFLIDPWFQNQGSGFSAKAVRPEMQGIKCPMNALPDSPESVLKGVEYCLVTHLHFDHFSVDYLPRDLRIIAQNQEDAEKIREMGFENAVAFESELLTIGGIVIHKRKRFMVTAIKLLKRWVKSADMYLRLPEKSVCISPLIQSTAQK